MLTAHILMILIPGIVTPISTEQIFESKAACEIAKEALAFNRLSPPLSLYPSTKHHSESITIAPSSCILSTIIRYFLKHHVT